MEVRSVNSNVILQINEQEKMALINAIKYIIFELDEELAIRTGFNQAEFDRWMSKLTIPFESLVTVTGDELTMIHQTLNEVLHGVKIDNFNSTIGMSEVELAGWLELIHI
jgi:hypothetical protein